MGSMLTFCQSVQKKNKNYSKQRLFSIHFNQNHEHPRAGVQGLLDVVRV